MKIAKLYHFRLGTHRCNDAMKWLAAIFLMTV
jgi:hypothetical protein